MTGNPFLDESTDFPPRFACIFGAACCLPGLHYPDECHTAEMLEAFFQDCQDDEREAS